MLTKVAVLATVSDSSGNPQAGAIVTAKLDRTDVDVSGGYVLPEQVIATTDASGQATLMLWPNALGSTESQYKISIANPDSGKTERFSATIPNANCNLHQVANLPAYEGKSDGQLVIDAAVAAVAPAVAAKLAAEQASEDATLAATSAAESSADAADSAFGAGNSATTAGNHANTAASYRDAALATLPVSSSSPPANPIDGAQWLDTDTGRKYTWLASQNAWAETGAIVTIDNPTLVEQARSDLAASAGASLVGAIQSGTGAVARTVQDKLRESISAADFGVTGVGDETTKVQAAINAAVAAGILYVRLDVDCTCSGAMTNRSSVVFVGAGELSGDGAYRRQSVPLNAPTTAPRFGDLVPHKHLQKFSQARSPKVVLVGSSTGAWLPDAMDGSAALVHLLQDRLTRFNKGKTVTLYNRAIGGQTYVQLDGIPTEFPAWYTNQASSWLSYVQALAPDAVFIVMGSNDSSTMSHPTLVSVVNKIKAFAKVPDIVFITQPSVSLDPHADFAVYGTKSAQEGRDYAAGLIRSFAEYEGYGLIDGNRMGGIVLDGRDLLDTASKRIETSLALATGAYTATVPCHDFAFRLRFNGDAAAITAAFPIDSGNPVFVRTGAGGSGDSGDIVFIGRNGSGNFKLKFFSLGLSPTPYRDVDTNVPFPTSSFSLDVFKDGNTFGLSVYGSEDSTRMLFQLKSHGGEFLPRVGHHTLGTGPFATLEFFNAGEPRRYVPMLTSAEAFGEPSNSTSIKYPYGGNGVNHFTSLGVRAIYGHLLDDASLAAAPSNSGKYTPALSAPANLAAYSADECSWLRVGNIVTVTGKLAVTASAIGQVALDIALPVPSNLSATAYLAGIVNATATAGMTGAFFANDVTDTARLQLNATVTTSQNCRFTFTYEIQG